MFRDSAFWDRISGKYDQNVNKTYSQTYHDTIDYTKKYLKQTDEVLDFACGTGIITAQVANSVEQIHAIDISPKMLDAAKHKCQDEQIKNISFDVMTIFDASLQKESYDVIFAFNVLCYMRDYKKAVKRIYQLLKPGGVFISATDCDEGTLTIKDIRRFIKSLFGRIPYIKRFTVKGLEKAIEKHFQIMQAENLHEPKEPNYFIAAKKQE